MNERAAPQPVRESLPSWLRAHLFSNWPSTLVTLAIVYLAWKWLATFIGWAFLESVW
jgi:hypothetical protein